MKSVGSDIAAKTIKDACKSKYKYTTSSVCVEKEAQIHFFNSHQNKSINHQIKSFSRRVSINSRET